MKGESHFIRLAGKRSACELPPESRLIHLYSDASEIGNIYRPEVGLCGSVKTGVEDILPPLRQHPDSDKQKIADRKQVVDKLHEAFIRRREVAFEGVSNQHPLTVTSLASELATVVDSDTTVVLDAPTSNEIIINV